jgi:sec-independent protein translocase protein TatC
MSDPAKDELEGTEQPFVSHLVELRDRLIRVVVVVVGLFIVLAFIWPKAGLIYDLFASPLVGRLPPGTKLIATSVLSPVMVPLKVSLLAAFLIALPYVLYQTWAFVAPGLYTHEKRLVMPLVVSSTFLFFVGVGFCYFLVIPAITTFTQGWVGTSIAATPDIEQYFGFALNLFIVFGIAFEVPVAVVVLARIGVVSIEQLKSFRGYFVVGAFVVSAVVTPPDVVSQLSLAIPMCILYEVGILCARIFIKHTQAPDADTEADRPARNG